MSKLLHRGARLARNVLLDLRFGAFLGGAAKRSPFAHLGANQSNNSDYGTLDQIFKDQINASDVLVDVGCGRGRVINWWLSRGLKNPIYGLELDPELAREVSARLRRWQNVSILTGSALDNLPSNATLLYLFNPFNEQVMTQFRDRVFERCKDKARLKILYYAPEHLSVFESDERWNVQRIELDMSHEVNYSERHRWLALVRPRLMGDAG